MLSFLAMPCEITILPQQSLRKYSIKLRIIYGSFVVIRRFVYSIVGACYVIEYIYCNRRGFAPSNWIPLNHFKYPNLFWSHRIKEYCLEWTQFLPYWFETDFCMHCVRKKGGNRFRAYFAWSHILSAQWPQTVKQFGEYLIFDYYFLKCFNLISHE